MGERIGHCCVKSIDEKTPDYCNVYIFLAMLPRKRKRYSLLADGEKESIPENSTGQVNYAFAGSIG